MLLQRVERGLGAALLVEAEHRVEDDDEQDGDRVAEPGQKSLVPSVREPHEDRDGGRSEEGQDERVGELAHHPQNDALARRLAELVGAVLDESGRRVLAREPLGRVDLERREQRVDLFGEHGTRGELRFGSGGDESVVAQCAIRVGAGGRGARAKNSDDSNGSTMGAEG